MFLEGLDALDQKIVRLLIENARISYSDIGQEVGISRVAVKAISRHWSSGGSLRNIPPSSILRRSAARFPAILRLKHCRTRWQR